MIELHFLFNQSPYLVLPIGLAGWLIWILQLGLVIFLSRQLVDFNTNWDREKRILFATLLVSVPVTSLILPGIRFSTTQALPVPLMPREPTEPVMMIFAPLPWILAAGLLGPWPAAALAALSGLMWGSWGWHDSFFPLQLALIALIFASLVKQNYRTLSYRVIRHPFIASLLIALVYLALFLLNSLFLIQGPLASRLDYTVTHLLVAALAIGGSLAVSGLFAELVARIWPRLWRFERRSVPSPAESRLEARFLYGLAPLAIILITILIVGDWYVAGAAARKMLQGRMENAGEMAAQSVPFFLETGQNLILQLSENPQLRSSDLVALRDLLSEDLKAVPYFRQLFVFNASGEPVLGYPIDDAGMIINSQEERDAIQRAVAGDIPIQYLPVQAEKGESAAQMSFIATFSSESGVLDGVLVGRSDLTVNPFVQPLLTSLKSMSQVGGEGILLDEDGRILYHPNPDLVMTTYDVSAQTSSKFFEDTSFDGTRQFVYYQPALGRQWSVILTAPALYVQEQALSIAAPLLATIIIASLIAVGVFRLSLRAVTASLQTLTVEADRLAKGQLDRPLPIEGEDEVGQLRRAFEKMRTALKARLDELNRLLVVSQGVASTLELEGSLRPVLDSALMTGASSARVTLDPELVPDLGGETPQSLRFGAGSSCELYGSLDDQILALTRRQEKVLLTNLSRPRILTIPQGLPRPYALLALALRHENRFYGTLWVAYDEPHQFSDEEVRFISTLAGQAALAASNARLFLTAEIGRQRLEAILASTPDPVLVTDEHDCLLLSNPAAWQALGFDVEAGQGKPIDQVLSQQQLVDLLRSSSNENQSAEIVVQPGLVYLATASSVLAGDKRMGRICVLRDVTHFKEIDSLKSDFVSTVSHDLRSPLTLIRGYATMLQMVGELNEQQAGYIQKIVTGVESMSRLVNNLLDLGRIEAGIGLQLEVQTARELAANVVAPLQLQAAQKRIQLIAEIPDESDIQIEADQALLQQALHNLVENAIKYTEAGGEVKFCYHQQNDQIIFEVQDTGIGIAPADQQRLFEKFYRSSRKGIRSERGSGLGLSIVKSIAERHGGRVWFESHLGKGSTFSMAIPLNQTKNLR